VRLNYFNIKRFYINTFVINEFHYFKTHYSLETNFLEFSVFSLGVFILCSLDWISKIVWVILVARSSIWTDHFLLSLKLSFNPFFLVSSVFLFHVSLFPLACVFLIFYMSFYWLVIITVCSDCFCDVYMCR